MRTIGPQAYIVKRLRGYDHLENYEEAMHTATRNGEWCGGQGYLREAGGTNRTI